MRAYKTVNDLYIEPISFTVPRRAETFQSDIFPPAVGLKPALSGQDWLSGKTALPAKIDLESIYDGNAPVEVPADYKPPATTTTSAPAPAPVMSPTKTAPPKKEPERTPAPVRSGPPPSMSDQKQSIATMATKFQDDEEESSDDDEADTSSFEEIGRPQPRHTPVAAVASAPAKQPALSSYKSPKPASQVPSPVTSRTPTITSPEPPAASAVSSGGGDIADTLAKLTSIVQAQNSKIDSLASEVKSLKAQLQMSSQQSERIRQLELELEEVRS